MTLSDRHRLRIKASKSGIYCVANVMKGLPAIALSPSTTFLTWRSNVQRASQRVRRASRTPTSWRSTREFTQAAHITRPKILPNLQNQHCLIRKYTWIVCRGSVKQLVATDCQIYMETSLKFLVLNSKVRRTFYWHCHLQLTLKLLDLSAIFDYF